MRNRLLKALNELKKERATIKEFNIWGGNNWESMDIEIEKLEELSKAKNLKEALMDLECEVEEKIDEIEDNYSEDEYTQMEEERKPWQSLSELIYEIKTGQ